MVVKKKHKKHADYSWIFLPIVLLLTLFLSFVFINDGGRIDKVINYTPNTISYNEIMSSSSTANVNDCKFIEDEQSRKICELKLTVCENDDCFYQKAIVNSDEQLCFNIKNDNKRTSCTTSIKKDTIIRNSILNNDVIECNKFQDSDYMAYCYDNFYYAKRMNTNDKFFVHI